MPRALIVDDEPGIRLALKRWFERQGYDTLETGDGAHALAQLMASGEGDDAIDVIVCDVHLPGMSGDRLLAHLSAERPALATRVILTTGDPVNQATPGSVLASHSFVLQKPFEFAELKAIVDRVIGT